jgi:hypothetical protein
MENIDYDYEIEKMYHPENFEQLENKKTPEEEDEIERRIYYIKEAEWKGK